MLRGPPPKTRPSSANPEGPAEQQAAVQSPGQASGDRSRRARPAGRGGGEQARAEVAPASRATRSSPWPREEQGQPAAHQLFASTGRCASPSRSATARRARRASVADRRNVAADAQRVGGAQHRTPITRALPRCRSAGRRPPRPGERPAAERELAPKASDPPAGRPLPSIVATTISRSAGRRAVTTARRRAARAARAGRPISSLRPPPVGAGVPDDR